jgi:hypothetical protein
MAKEAGGVDPKTAQPGDGSNREYAKKCSGYQNFTYCMIESIENRGNVVFLWKAKLNRSSFLHVYPYQYLFLGCNVVGLYDFMLFNFFEGVLQ